MNLPNITHLKISSYCALTNLFTSLTHLYIDCRLEKDALIPLVHLTYLQLGGRFNQYLLSLPNLTHLKLNRNYNNPLPNLPKLEHLYVGPYFDYPIDHLPQLLTLEIEGYFNTNMSKQSLNNTYYIQKYGLLTANMKRTDILQRCDINNHNLLCRKTGLFDDLL